MSLCGNARGWGVGVTNNHVYDVSNVQDSNKKINIRLRALPPAPSGRAGQISLAMSIHRTLTLVS